MRLALDVSAHRSSSLCCTTSHNFTSVCQSSFSVSLSADSHTSSRRRARRVLREHRREGSPAEGMFVSCESIESPFVVYFQGLWEDRNLDDKFMLGQMS